MIERIQEYVSSSCSLSKDSFRNINLYSIEVNENALRSLDKEIAQRNCCFPFEIKDNLLCVAMSKPLSVESINEIKFASKYNLEIYVSEKEQIFYFINTYYQKLAAKSAVKDFKNKQMPSTSIGKDNFGKDIKSGDAPIIRLVDSLIIQALNKSATDIHFEPFDKILRVRMRIDGILYEELIETVDVYPAICTRVKVLSNIDIGEKRLPQDGRIIFKWNEKEYDLRVSSITTFYGEKLVIRILYKETIPVSLEKLGFGGTSLKLIRKSLASSQGMILITGPTGSGKSTTLYSMLNELNNDEKNIMTIEDPIEYTIFGLNQISINNKSGLTFSKGLRSVLRQDPDIIMLGEIRDEETAKIAVRASITGHLLLSTLHTNDSVSAISRLRDMGVQSYLLADALSAVIAQRLIRVLCPSCKVKDQSNSFEYENLGLDDKASIYKPKGCHYCNNTGYKGRTAIYELLSFDSEMKNLVYNMASTDTLRKFNKDRGRLGIIDHCKVLVKSGITSCEELIKVQSTF